MRSIFQLEEMWNMTVDGHTDQEKKGHFSQKIKSTKAQNLFEQRVIEVKKIHSKRMKHFRWCFRAFGWKLQVAPLSLSLRLFIIKKKKRKRRKESEP